MIIPTSEKDINIGDKVITTKIIYGDYYIIPCGHEFIVKDYNKDYNYYILKDLKSDLIIDKIYENYITLKTSINDARNEFIYKKEVENYKKYIQNECINKENIYEDRDTYIGCKIQKSYGYECTPVLKCVKYLSDKQIKKNKYLVKHLRKHKINNLK